MKEKKIKTKLIATINDSQNELIINTSEKIIAITESKIRLLYAEHIKNVGYGEKCLSFFGLFLTCITPSLTSQFQDYFDIENFGLFIHFAFVLFSCVFIVLTVVFFCKWLKLRKKYSIDSFIDKLEKN